MAKKYKQINIENVIIKWLLAGVTIKEIQARLGMLGCPMTFEEIKQIGDNF